jgi:prepilin-type N-terminal cleavage/methylation domain-containing protein
MLSPLTSSTPRKRGFTFVETLACILVIGILASIAISWYARQRDVVLKVSRQRNAQEIVSLAVCATVAGCDFVVPGDKFNTIQNLIIGTYGTTGIYKGKLFRLTSLELDQLPESIPFVKMEENLILYDYTGSQPL